VWHDDITTGVTDHEKVESHEITWEISKNDKVHVAMALSTAIDVPTIGSIYIYIITQVILAF